MSVFDEDGGAGEADVPTLDDVTHRQRADGPPFGPTLTQVSWGERTVFYHCESDNVFDIAQTAAWIESDTYYEDITDAA